MKRFISYGSIEQFRNVVKKVRETSQYIGYDEEKNKAIFDRSIKAPTLEFIGSEKNHGSNASVCFGSGDFWIQSRKNIITPEKDNAGCAFFVEQTKESWLEIINNLATYHKIDLDKNIISLYFEWVGGNIQRKSCMSGLDKRAVIFQHFKISPLESQNTKDENDTTSYWLETKIVQKCREFWLDIDDKGIYNVMNYKVWNISIDFENPLMSQNKIIEYVEEMESNSPIGQAMGKDGNIGEGIVWTSIWNNQLLRFKSKGNLHSRGSGKVKNLKPVDEVFEQKKIDFVNNIACTESRLEQSYNEVFDTINGGKGDVKKTGDYIRSVIKDIMKEEMDIMLDLGIEPKQINGKVSKVSREYMLSRLDNETFK